MIAEHTLDNGLKIVVCNRKSPLIYTSCNVNSGFFFEDERNNGIAHFLEHVLLEATTTYTEPYQLHEMIEQMGGMAGGVTNHLRTQYHADLPQPNWPRGMELLADQMQHPLFAERDIEKERRIVSEEIKLKPTYPPYELQDMTYTNAPYTFRGLGSREGIMRMGRPELEDFFEKHYVPNNMRIYVVGGIKPQTVFKKIESLYGGMEKKKLQVLPPIKVETGKDRTISGSPRQTAVMGGIDVPGLGKDNILAMTFVVNYLGFRMGSRLKHELHTVKGFSYGGNLNYEDILRDRAFIVANFLSTPENLPSIREIISRELGRLRAGDIDKVCMDRTRVISRTDYLMKQESGRNFISFLYYLDRLGMADKTEEWPDMFLNVTEDDVVAFAQKYFDEKRMNWLTVLPEKKV